MVLELETVRDIARVVVNDIDCGVAWTSPYQVDVSAALRPGINRLQVHTTTPWRNRLIAEATNRTGDLFEPMTHVFDPDATPCPAGLTGHVNLLAASA